MMTHAKIDGRGLLVLATLAGAALALAACHRGSGASSGCTDEACGRSCTALGFELGGVCQGESCVCASPEGGDGGAGGEGGGGGGGDGGGDGGGGDGSGGGGGGEEGGGPVFLSFGTSVSAMTEGDSVTFSAVLTDPDGIDDLVGGVLETEDGTPVGTFATSASEGAYELELSWSDLDGIRDLSFTGEERRTFVAGFFDVAGHRTSRSTELRMHCDGGGGIACSGECTDLSTDRHCGACGNDCSDTASGCTAGRCFLARYLDRETDRVPTCGEACAEVGAACITTCVAGPFYIGSVDFPSYTEGSVAGVAWYDGFGRDLASCSERASDSIDYSVSALRCCCERLP